MAQATKKPSRPKKQAARVSKAGSMDSAILNFREAKIAAEAETTWGLKPATGDWEKDRLVSLMFLFLRHLDKTALPPLLAVFAGYAGDKREVGGMYC